jgi:hypothetical protein
LTDGAFGLAAFGVPCFYLRPDSGWILILIFFLFLFPPNTRGLVWVRGDKRVVGGVAAGAASFFFLFLFCQMDSSLVVVGAVELDLWDFFFSGLMQVVVKQFASTLSLNLECTKKIQTV